MRVAMLTRWVVLGLFSCLIPAYASAGLVVSIDSTSIAAGDTGSVNVWISSDSALDAVQSFGVEFQITTAGGSELWFVQSFGVPPDTHLGSPDYLFAATGSAAMAFPPMGAVGPDTTYVGVDVSDDLAGVGGPFSDYLLATLDLTTLTGSPPVAGDTFTISIVHGVNTFFADGEFNLIDYQSTPGTVTITGANPIPEPGSLVLALIGAGIVGTARRSRRPFQSSAGHAS